MFILQKDIHILECICIYEMKLHYFTTQKFSWLLKLVKKIENNSFT